MPKLFRGMNKDYDNYRCSKCNEPLNPDKKQFGEYYHIVGDDADEEGYEWRGFDDKCWEDVQHLSNEEIMAQYEPAQLIE